VGGALLKPQTIKQILCCLVLGRYTACVGGGELRISGPQPLAGPLPASVKARKDELVAFLDEYCGGAWPPAPGSPLRPAVGRESKALMPAQKKPLTAEEKLEKEEF
jgi:hypothetical protein